MVPGLILLLFTLLIGAVRSRPYPLNSTVGVVWTFDNLTWIENLAVRQNGELLCTSLNRAALYLVNPFEKTASVVHQFEPTEGLLGITEVQDDVFAIASANLSLATGKASPGSSKIWKVDMATWEMDTSSPVTLAANLTHVGLPNGMTTLDFECGIVLLADAGEGVVWRIDTNTGAYSKAIPSVSYPEYFLDIDGIHIANGFLYYTQFAANLFGRLPINGDGSPAGPNRTIAMLAAPDDFALAPDGAAYVAGLNTLSRVGVNGTVNVVAGGPKDLVLEGATSAQFGRTGRDHNTLYVGTNGGLLIPVDGEVHGGQILAVNVARVY